MTPPEELKSQSAAIAVEGIVDPGQGRPGGGAEAAHPVGAGAAHLVASDSTAVGEVGHPGEAGHPLQGGVEVVKKRWATRIVTWSLSEEGVDVRIHVVGQPHLLSKLS